MEEEQKGPSENPELYVMGNYEGGKVPAWAEGYDE